MKKSLLPLLLAAVAVDASAARFTSAGPDTVRDAKTGFEWTASDGVQPLTWTASVQRCAALGDGWRLPTADELVTLYDKSGKLVTTCGPGKCKVSPLFQLHEVMFWSGDVKGADATLVALDEANRMDVLNGGQHSFQSLCVLPKKGKPAKH